LVEYLDPPNDPEDFPPQQVVEPGTVRFGIYRHHPYYQCEHMGDIAVLPLSINGWHVVSENPLTVQPSILNVECGCHGFITDGRWNPV
jgi:hypothetical protein